MIVPESYLAIRKSVLRGSQNPDGGWGYFRGKQSWLEPTAYAALVLNGEPAADRAWDLLCSWQGADGALRPNSDVDVRSWGTALWLNLASARGVTAAHPDAGRVRKGLEWILSVRGAEIAWHRKVMAGLRMYEPDRDLRFTGWPWKVDNSSWVEPTAHAIVALRRLAKEFGSPELQERVRLAQGQLLDLRCSDGGWNYGSREVFKHDLPSYPETTGLALLGLQENHEIGASLNLAAKSAQQRWTPMASSWLSIALRLHGRPVPASGADALPPGLHEVALEALAAPEGNFEFFKTEAHT